MKPNEPCPKCGSMERHKGGRCAPCRRARTKDWQKRNPEKVAAMSRDWVEANPERRKENLSAWRETNREKLRESQGAWREGNLEGVRASANKYREKNREQIRERRRDLRYGLKQGEYAALLISQNECCAVCEDRLDFAIGTHIDHDHATGKVRGVLCRGCNIAIGCLKDDPARARKLAAYLDNPPALVLVKS